MSAGLPIASFSLSISTLWSTGLRGGVKRRDVDDSDSASEGVGVEMEDIDEDIDDAMEENLVDMAEI